MNRTVHLASALGVAVLACSAAGAQMMILMTKMEFRD